MKNLILILVLMNTLGCSEGDDDASDQYNFDVGLRFTVVNDDGENLLDPDNPEHFSKDTIKLFYLINGEKQEVYDGNLDSPRNYKIFEVENEYVIGITPNYSETEETPITYIQWDENDTDTLEVSYERKRNAVIQTKIWLNGEQIWERYTNEDPYFTLVK
ncbi:hypothetical protein [Flavimarina sp. Hel_I_48]|uniref:hypothetical protein n=1 Tax=Flavimarina sp. Hel_I_48 TaxID=1392488 RepID=UPI0004DEF5EA|nr:hypothetical protein [Flavimarina sp. Hel_I_48]